MHVIFDGFDELRLEEKMRVKIDKIYIRNKTKRMRVITPQP